MKKYYLLVTVYCLLTSVGSSQNLVSNGSFENIASCTLGAGTISFATGWSGVSSPDLLNICSASSSYSVPINGRGSQVSYEGSGYGFVVTYASPPSVDVREYIQSQLISSLTQNTKYYLSFQISFADIFQSASDGIGAYFSMDTIYGQGVGQIIDSVPQVLVPAGIPIVDKTNWIQVDGCFIAKGGESFLTIGNFKHDNDLTIQNLGGSSPFGGYYLDDVQLHKIPAFKSDSNHFICSGIVDSVFLDLSDTSEVTTYSWFPTNGLTSPTSPKTWAKPTVTTTYTLSQYTPCDTSTIDVTVYVDCDSIVSVESLNFPLSNFKLFPNPNNGEFNIVLENYNNAEIEIFNVLGELVYQSKLTNRTSTININNHPKGFYLVIVTSNNASLIKRMVKY
jgi:hypothetical protein